MENLDKKYTAIRFAKRIVKNDKISGRIFIIFIIFLLYLIFNQHQSLLYYDSKFYWELGSSFFKKGVLKTFAISNFSDPMRGYLYPLILLPANIFSSLSGLPPLFISKIIGALSAALLLGFALPQFWSLLSTRVHINYLKTLLLTFLVVVFWGDYFSFTITDFLSFTMILCAFIFLDKRNWHYTLISGVLLASSINFRPSTLILLPFFALFFLINYKYYFKKIVCIFCFIAGFALVSAPQFVINRANFNSSSPFVLGKTPEGKNLYVWHLYWGMKTQKFETLYPNTKVPLYVTDDPVGEKLLIKINNGNRFNNAGEYLNGFIKFPAEYISLYWRHLFNELDVKYSTPYLLSPKIYWYKNILNYILLFFGSLLLVRSVRKSSIDSIIMVVGFLAIVGVMLPLVPESRFAMPLHLLMLSALVYSKSLFTYWRFCMMRGVKMIPILFLCFIWVIICVSASAATNSLTHLKLTFDF